MLIVTIVARVGREEDLCLQNLPWGQAWGGVKQSVQTIRTIRASAWMPRMSSSDANLLHRGTRQRP